MTKPAFILACCLAAQPAGAAQFGALNLKDISAEAPRAAAPAANQGNYYLDPDSYDPLLMRRSGQGEKISVIGGTIDIPGMDGTLDFARKYRQAAYSVHDLQSDVALTVYTKSIMLKVLSQALHGIAQYDGLLTDSIYNDINPVIEDAPSEMLTESEINALNIPQDEKDRMIIQLHNSDIQLEGRVNPFREKEMLNMMMQIIKEEQTGGIEPKFGEPHTWSPEFISYCKKKGEMIPLHVSKLLTALASGVTSRHFKTGTEETLISYILSREESSVTMDQMFRASYRLNRGDVYLTILTIENVLSDHWSTPGREKLAVTRKLANISNFYNGKGDKYGAWYHFHGIMLYAYVRGGFRAALISGMETAGSHVTSGKPEHQEDALNSVGGRLGSKLAKIVNKKLYASFTPDKNYCDPAVYLNLHEDFRDRLEFVESRDFSSSLDENRLWLKSLYRDYLDCHVEVMYNDYTGKLNSSNLAKKDHVNFKKGKDVAISLGWPDDLRLARAFISGCVKSQPAQKGFGGAAPSGVYVDAVKITQK